MTHHTDKRSGTRGTNEPASGAKWSTGRPAQHTDPKTDEAIIEEFKKSFVKDNGPDVEPSFLDPNGSVGPAVAFIRTALSKARADERKRMVSFIEDTALADGFVGFSPDQWSAVQKFISILTSALKLD